MDQSKALAALSALAHADRLSLIRLVLPKGDEGMAAGAIARALGLSASGLSFHLGQLEQAGLLRSRKVARHVFYAVDRRGLGETISYLLSDCCQDNPEVLACCQPGSCRETVTEPAEPAAPRTKASPPSPDPCVRAQGAGIEKT